MLQSVGSQRVGHDLATEKQQRYIYIPSLTLMAINYTGLHGLSQLVMS